MSLAQTTAVRLQAEFRGRVDPPVIARVVSRCQALLRGQGCPTTALPELVERLARTELTELTAAVSPDRPADDEPVAPALSG